MSGSEISGTIKTTVTLGTGVSISPLTVTGSGLIDPSGHEAVGIYLPMGIGGRPTLVNDGRVYGASGKNGGLGEYGTNRGVGAVLAYSPVNILNNGLMSGGTGGHGYNIGPGGGYAVGLSGTAASSLTNTGTMSGGAGGYGRMEGGHGGGGVVALLASTVTITNSGTIHGGDGGESSFDGGSGGYGIRAGKTAIQNSGEIVGGAGGTDAVSLGAQGGGGVCLARAADLSNSGTIAGGIGGLCYYGTGGSGGAGVTMAGGGTLVNTGKIIGGAGGNGYYPELTGAGGAGVELLEGGTLINAGTIGGGLGIAKYGQPPAYADAVLFSGFSGGVLVLEPGATFLGNVVANSTEPDVLELAGTSSNALVGIGTDFTGFTDIEFAPGASWTITGDVAGLTTGHIISGFGAKDAIVVDDFAATYGAFTHGGLMIRHGSTVQTMYMAGSLTGDFIGVTNGGDATSITEDASTSGLRLTKGFELVGSRGVAIGTTVGSDACLTVLSGGHASGSVISAGPHGGKGDISLLVGDGGYAVGTTIKNHSDAKVTAGGTVVSPRIEAKSLLDVTGTGQVDNATIAGGTLALFGGGTATGGITFMGEGGVLQFAAAPSNTIYGFTSGNDILFSGTTYESNDSVAVIANNDVSVTLNGISVDLTIAGATVGETDFSLSSGSDGTYLTRNVESAAMGFMAPVPMIVGGGTEFLATHFVETSLPIKDSPTVWTASAAPHANIGLDLLRVFHGGAQFDVPFHNLV